MGALVAILQNDPNLMRCQLARLAGMVSLTDTGRLPEAYGFGYYTAADLLLGKRPTGAASLLTLAQLVGEVDTDVLVAHARYSVIQNPKDENTQPYRFRRWLFAHDGAVEDFAQVKPKLLASLPEFLRRNVAGETDTEHAFMLFLRFLRDEGRLDDLDLEAADAGDALARTVRQIDAWCREAGAQRPSALNFIATNGRILVATRRGRPLHYALLEGIHACQIHPDPEAGEADRHVRTHRQVKAVCFATRLLHGGVPAAGHPGDAGHRGGLAGSGFLEVPEASVVAVGRSLQVTVRQINSHGG